MSCVKAAGIESIIVGCQVLSIARAQIKAAQAIDLRVDATYAFLWDEETPSMRTAEAITGARFAGVNVVWLDVEDGRLMPASWAQRFADVTACVQQVRDAGLTPGIYTGGPFWQGLMANTDAFKGLPLWFAAYYNDRRLIEEVDFGGWTKCAIHQYASDIMVCGENVDHNHVWTPVGQEDVLTKEEKEQLDSLIAWREQVMTQLYDHDIGPTIDAYVEDNEKQVLTLQNINRRLGGALATAQGGAPSTSIPPHQHKGGPTGGVL